MHILAIETSCDETAAAVVVDGCQVLSNVIASQADLHALTGGVVPEVASREHVRQLPWIYKKALTEANLDWEQIDAVAATETPGLIGSLLVGIQTARTLAEVHNKPYIAVNHIYGHIFSNWLERKPDQDIKFPLLSLTVSGGHTNLYLITSPREIKLLGSTKDDAAGEAFDKVAKLMDLPYPGGPEISKLAVNGDPMRFKLPVAQLDQPYDFSFSGLKTAVLYLLQDLKVQNDGTLPEKLKADLAASFEHTVAKTLAGVCRKAIAEFNPKQVHLAGGVAANSKLRKVLEEAVSTSGNIDLLWPAKMTYCTDNAAMIASAAYFN